jgi:hypothetical protein
VLKDRCVRTPCVLLCVSSCLQRCRWCRQAQGESLQKELAVRLCGPCQPLSCCCLLLTASPRWTHKPHQDKRDGVGLARRMCAWCTACETELGRSSVCLHVFLCSVVVLVRTARAPLLVSSHCWLLCCVASLRSLRLRCFPTPPRAFPVLSCSAPVLPPLQTYPIMLVMVVASGLVLFQGKRLIFGHPDVKSVSTSEGGNKRGTERNGAHVVEQAWLIGAPLRKAC